MRVKIIDMKRAFIALVLPMSVYFLGCEQAQRDTTSDDIDDITVTRVTDYEINIEYESVKDSAITQALIEELYLQNGVSNKNIAISTNEGIVMLTGEVSNILQKERTVQIAQMMKGVRGVVNQIDIATSGVDDTDITLLLRQALVRNPVTESLEITPAVLNGNVTIEGEVDSWQERQIAENVIKGVKGVKSLTNNLTYETGDFRPDEEIEKDVINILDWDVRVDNEMINVNVENGTVYLSGIVGSVSEKIQAENLAMSTGVAEVVSNELSVERWARDTELRSSKYTFRTDDAIETAIYDAFSYDLRVNSFEIIADVNDGYVTLKGDVANLMAKDAAAQDAQNIVGVWGVKNMIAVDIPTIPADSTIGNNVEISYAADPYLESYEIAVNVEDGEVVLSGVVSSFFEKNRAEKIASFVKGVSSVENELTIEGNNILPYVYDYSYQTFYPKDEVTVEFENIKSDQEILADTKDQIYWSPFINEEEVQIDVEGGIVTLTGTVQTPRERLYAEKNAYEAGAITVNNDIYVAYGPNPTN